MKPTSYICVQPVHCLFFNIAISAFSVECLTFEASSAFAVACTTALTTGASAGCIHNWTFPKSMAPASALKSGTPEDWHSEVSPKKPNLKIRNERIFAKPFGKFSVVM
jgi:hypothetical protein